MVPVAQSIIADSFPPEKRSQGFALFSISMRHDPQTRVRLDTPRRITMLAYNGSEILDITGPLDVFAIANGIHLDTGGQLPLYQLEIAGDAKDAVLVTSSGIRLLADTSWGECSGADTLLVAGGQARQAPEELVNCLRHDGLPGLATAHLARLGERDITAPWPRPGQERGCPWQAMISSTPFFAPWRG